MNRADILSKINDPKELEKLYQGNKMTFKKEFNLLYPELTDNRLADYWNERLNYESFEISWGGKNELIFVIIASMIAVPVFPIISLIIVWTFMFISSSDFCIRKI